MLLEGITLVIWEARQGGTQRLQMIQWSLPMSMCSAWRVDTCSSTPSSSMYVINWCHQFAIYSDDGDVKL